MSKDQLQYIYGLCSCSHRAIEALLEGPSPEALQSLAISQIIVPLEESPKIQLHADDDDDDWMEAAFTIYKNKRFDKIAGVRINIRGQPAVVTLNNLQFLQIETTVELRSCNKVSFLCYFVYLTLTLNC